MCRRERADQELAGQASGEAAGVRVADAGCLKLRQQPGRVGGQDGVGEGGAKSRWRARRRRPGRRRRPEYDARANGDERQGQEIIAQRLGDAAGDGRSVEPRVGSLPHGVPFDVVGCSFPSRPWRSATRVGAAARDPSEVKVVDRPAKLRACGNAVVPAVLAFVVGRVLVAVMRRRA